MWHDGDRWNCLCGWQGDYDDWLVADAMSRVLIAWSQDEIENGLFDLNEKLKPLGTIEDTDALVIRVAGAGGRERWSVRTMANLRGGKCGCCADHDHFTLDQIREIRLIRIRVDEL